MTFELAQSDDDVGKFVINVKLLKVGFEKVNLVFQVSFSTFEALE